MKSAIMIRRTKPISVSRLPDRSDSREKYFAAMLEGSKALCQSILETNKLHGPMTEMEQVDAIGWAYDVKVIR